MRVEESTPFSVTCLDFTGNLCIRQPNGNEGKAYICLFTCATTRAVHLEVVTNMSADSFLQAFRRFVSWKSLPKLIISDNATTFQSASTYLKTFFDSTSVRDFCQHGDRLAVHTETGPVVWRMVGKTYRSHQNSTEEDSWTSLPEPRDTTDGRYRDRNHHERSSIDVRFSEPG